MAKELEVKGFGPFEVKDEDRGEVEAIVASMDTPDRDGDVFLSGSMRSGNRVKLSWWGHDAVLRDAPPVGIGSIEETDGRAVFKGRFFTTTERGREAFATVKEMGADGEWSFGFPRADAKTTELTEDWREKGARRLYEDVNPIEASPVLRPAGFGTGTLSVKAEQSLTDRLEAVNEALMSRNEGLDHADWWWAREVFDDHVIVEGRGRLLRVPYALGEDGAAELRGTEAVEVEVEYREVEAEGDGEDEEETRSAEEETAVKALRSLKAENNLTDAELASALEVKEKEVAGILSGDTPCPALSDLAAVKERLPSKEDSATEEEQEIARAEVKRFELNTAYADALEAKRKAEADLAEAEERVTELKAKRDAEAEFQDEIQSELAQFERTRRRVGVL